MIELKHCRKPDRAGCPFCAELKTNSDPYQKSYFYCMKWRYVRGSVLIYACEKDGEVHITEEEKNSAPHIREPKVMWEALWFKEESFFTVRYGHFDEKGNKVYDT